MMKKFLHSLAIVLVLWFATDRLGGCAMHWAYTHSHDWRVQKLHTIATGVDADVVLLGTSRCLHHYVPSILADTLRARVYNAGIDGSSNIFFQYMSLVYILRSHTPKVVVLDTGESEFSDNGEYYPPLSLHAPNVGLCHEADSLFRLAGYYGWYKLSHLYRYHSLAHSLVSGMFPSTALALDDGYLPLHPTPSQALPIPGDTLPQPPTDTFKLDYLRRFVRCCHSHGILLVLSISPSYSTPDTHYYDALKGLAGELHVPLLDYDTSGLLLDHPEYFKDQAHLLDQGARCFSQHFAHDLRPLVEQKLHP